MPPRAHNPHFETFLCIKAFFRLKEHAPTLDELAKITGRSIGAINRHVMLLNIQGYLTRTPHIYRGIQLTGKELDPQLSADNPRPAQQTRKAAKKSQRKDHSWKTVMPRLSHAQQQARIEMVVAKALRNEQPVPGEDVVQLSHGPLFKNYRLRASRIG